MLSFPKIVPTIVVERVIHVQNEIGRVAPEFFELLNIRFLTHHNDDHLNNIYIYIYVFFELTYIDLPHSKARLRALSLAPNENEHELW